LSLAAGSTIVLTGCGNTTDPAPKASSELIADDTAAYKAIYQSETPVLVEFVASWAENSTKMAPIVKESVEEYKGDLKLVRLDIDKTQQTAQLFEVNTVPTLVLVSKNCKHGKTLIGLHEKDEVTMFVRNSFTECK